MRRHGNLYFLDHNQYCVYSSLGERWRRLNARAKYLLCSVRVNEIGEGLDRQAFTYFAQEISPVAGGLRR